MLLGVEDALRLLSQLMCCPSACLILLCLLQEWNSENAHDASVLLGVEDVLWRLSQLMCCPPPCPLLLCLSQEWNSENAHDASVLLGVEDVFRRDPAAGSGSGWGVRAGRIGVQFQQWTLAGAPHHPVYCSMTDRIE